MNIRFLKPGYVKNHIRNGSNRISHPELWEKSPKMVPPKPTHYKYEEVKINIGPDIEHAKGPVEYLLGEESNPACVVRLPTGWVVSGPLI